MQPIFPWSSDEIAGQNRSFNVFLCGSTCISFLREECCGALLSVLRSKREHTILQRNRDIDRHRARSSGGREFIRPRPFLEGNTQKRISTRAHGLQNCTMYLSEDSQLDLQAGTWLIFELCPWRRVGPKVVRPRR